MAKKTQTRFSSTIKTEVLYHEDVLITKIPIVRWAGKYSFYFPVIASLVGGLIALLIFLTGFLYRFEYNTFDQRYEIKIKFQKPPKTDEVALVVLQEALDDLRIPLSKYPVVWAGIQEALQENDARGFAYDIIFLGPYEYPTSSEIAYIKEEIAQETQIEEEDEISLAEEIDDRFPDYKMITQFQNVMASQPNTFLACSFTLLKKGEFTKEGVEKWDTSGLEKPGISLDLALRTEPLGEGQPYEAVSILSPSLFINKAKGIGSISTPPDEDGVTRRVPLILKYKGNYYPSLHLQAACYYLGCSPQDCRVIWGRHVEVVSPDKRVIRNIPIDNKGRMLIYFVGDNLQAFSTAYEVGPLLQSIRQYDEGEPMEVDLNEYSQKMVVTGVAAEAASDIGSIPIAKTYPMMGTVANSIQGIISGNFIRQASKINNAILILIGSLVVGFFGLRFKRYHLVLLGTGQMILYGLVSYFAFSRFNLWIDFFHVELGAFTSITLVTLYHLVEETRKKAFVQGLFGRYVSPDVVKELIADPSKIQLGGTKKELTIMFTDISGFTSMSEKMTPGEVVDLLNFYFEDMAGIVFENKGTLDKYIGDAMMVLYGAPLPDPDHAFKAVRAGFKMQQRMVELAKIWESEGKPVITMRIGVNTGEVIVGNIGSKRKLDYTVIGDNVNLAQRLEANAPKGGVLISKATYERVKGRVKVKEREPIMVKGKAKAVDIYEVVDLIE